MPSKKKKAKGLSPQEIQKINRDNVNHQMEVMPALQFEDINSNSNQMMDGLFGRAIPLIEGLMGRGEQTMANNPMMSMFEALGLSGGSEPLPPPDLMPQGPAAPPPQQPQMSPYEQQIQKLMADKGFSREQAIANQQNALQLGTDYNEDGAVTGDEWAKYGQTPDGAAYRQKHEGGQGQPQQGSHPPARRPGMGFFGHRGGMR